MASPVDFAGEYDEVDLRRWEKHPERVDAKILGVLARAVKEYRGAGPARSDCAAKNHSRSVGGVGCACEGHRSANSGNSGRFPVRLDLAFAVLLWTPQLDGEIENKGENDKFWAVLRVWVSGEHHETGDHSSYRQVLPDLAKCLLTQLRRSPWRTRRHG